ncbi:MAG: hypothetical protein FWC36_04970 [Spirochaetes bacterium]|nr:hypothetical protein [Spirochaetota bacterium]
MKTNSRIFVLLFLLFAIFSCGREEKKISIEDAEHPKVISINRGELRGNNLVFYDLKNRYKINSNNPVFFKAEIDRAKGPYMFAIHTSAWIKEIEFFALDKKTYIYFTIFEPSEIEAFSIRLLENSDRSFPQNITVPQLREVRLINQSDFVEGYIVSHNYVSQSENFRNIISDNKNTFVFDLDGYFNANPLSHIIIEVDAKPLNEIERPYIHFFTDGVKSTITAFPVKGRITITATDLSQIIPDFWPGKANTNTIVTINSPGSANIFDRISLIRNQIDISPLAALEADFGTIIDYPMANWRHREFELFSWTHFPEYLLIDTIDYRFQASMFKRLAFFAEKLGFAGQLLTDAELYRKHGWNAHNYKADDLSHFFNLAESTNFPITAEEKLLREILQANNIIKRENSKFVPIDGGILSISRETVPYLRRIFIMHEGYHAVYFALEEFREKTRQIWLNAPPNIKVFWELFLARRTYDITSEYLFLNEFMGFHLQQDPVRGQNYFFSNAIPFLERRLPEKVSFFNTLRQNYREEFYSISNQFAEAVFAVAGFPPGDLLFIRRVN